MSVHTSGYNQTAQYRTKRSLVLQTIIVSLKLSTEMNRIVVVRGRKSMMWNMKLRKRLALSV